MAVGTFHGLAIAQAIREALQAAYGATRPIPSGTYVHGNSAADRGGEDARAAIGGPIIEAAVTDLKIAKESPLQPCSHTFWDATITIRVVRMTSREHLLSPSARDSLHGYAATDGPTIAAALGYPSNYTHTSTGTAATGIISGRLAQIGSSVGLIEADDDGGKLVTSHRFSCRVSEFMWLPSELSPDLWLRADLGATVTQGTQDVTAWTDSGGASQAITVVDSPTRIYESVGLGLRNGITFDGASDALTAGSMAPSATTDVIDVIAVFRPPATAIATSNVVSKLVGVGNAGWATLWAADSATESRVSIYVEDNLGNVATIGPNTTGLTSGGIRVCRWQFDADSQTVTTSSNGSVSSTATGVISGTITNAETTAIFGAAVGQIALSADIGEVFVKFSPTGLTAVQLSTYTTYINARYGTSLTTI